MGSLSNSRTILGIDLGAQSIGWALIRNSSDEGQSQVVSGVRVFQAGLEDLEADGKGEARNAARREARSARRRLERHTRRLERLATILKDAGLLPAADYRESRQRHEVFLQLDRQYPSPYELRARSLNERLEPHALGRALYHLAQRRGFLSNRKGKQSEDEAKGKVTEQISGLHGEIVAEGCRTLGEFFAAKQFQSPLPRIRGKYLGRLEMIEPEFNAIWDSQQRFHPSVLTPELRKRVHRAIFYQRPLANQKNLIGRCQLEPKHRRAPWAMLWAQRFRVLQTVNNIRLTDPKTGVERRLSDAARRKLVDALQTQETMTYGGIRRVLPTAKGFEINLERMKQEKIPGNKTAARLAKAFGEDRWGAMSDAERDKTVAEWRSIVKDETLKKRGMKFWGLNAEQAKKFAEVRLEDGYCAFSRKAIMRLLPHLEAGKTVPEAIDEIDEYKARSGATPAVDALPPLVESGLPTLTNPVVRRSLTELRRVMNAIIAKYGKPDRIRIELARDLRQTAEQRARTHEQQNKNRKAREKAKAWLQENGHNPSDRNVDKFLLWEECNRECPYTGMTIGEKDLFGDLPRFDIEHIIPLDRCLDDSYLNKTLCENQENKRKNNRTPLEAYGDTPQWERIQARIDKFRGEAASAKRWRFLLTSQNVSELLDQFTTRQLNDTRWASKWAKKYLGLLYGGINDDGVDAFGTQRVQASSGGVTAFLRASWGLNKILGNDNMKSRDDHRHHTVDAVVIALTSPHWVKSLSDAARRGWGRGRRFDDVPPPWDGFHGDVKQAVSRIIVSHRCDRRVRGPLHKETFYSPQGDRDGKSVVHVRKSLSDLKEKDIAQIADPAIRRAVEARLNDLGIADPKLAFKDPANWPLDHRGNAIRRVRIKDNLCVFRVGDGHRRRWVTSESNHHIAIYEILNAKDEVTNWESDVVSLFEAHRRKSASAPVIRLDRADGVRFLFSLSGGEIIELDDPPLGRSLFRIRTVSDRLLFFPINDARKKDEVKKQDTFAGLTANPESLRKRHCRKVAVSLLGEIRYVDD